MLSEGGGDPVDGGFQSGSQSKAQGFIGRVAQTVERLPRLTRGMGQFKVTVHCLQHKHGHGDIEKHHELKIQQTEHQN